MESPPTTSRGTSAVPKVSFVVPCYRLAHLLPECIQSILFQSYTDFEILVMDDCSPDDTPAVARSFGDARVQHVRNPENLRQLRNYNRGIELSRGEYVWLISADDRLRRPYALEKYVALMDSHPQVGYAICPGVGLRDGEETGVLDFSRQGDQDAIFEGKAFFQRLLRGNSVIAASGLVRRRLYEQLGAFPLDLPYAGDWYLWLLFALHGDVGYLAEPMVNYREHPLSATSGFMADATHPWKGEGLVVAWRMKRTVEGAGRTDLAADCEDSLVRQYGSSLSRFGMSAAAFEQSLRRHSSGPDEARRIRIRSYLRGGDAAFWAGHRRLAATLYGAALQGAPGNREAWVKYLLLHLGRPGDRVRESMGARRRRDRRMEPPGPGAPRHPGGRSPGAQPLG
jgi:hypothetical protein